MPDSYPRRAPKSLLGIFKKKYIYKCHHLLALHLFQICLSFFLLWTPTFLKNISLPSNRFKLIIILVKKKKSAFLVLVGLDVIKITHSGTRLSFIIVHVYKRTCNMWIWIWEGGAICCDSTMRSSCQRAVLNPPQGRLVLWLKWRAYRLSNPLLFSHSYSRSMGFCCQRCKCFGGVTCLWNIVAWISFIQMACTQTRGWLWSHVEKHGELWTNCLDCHLYLAVSILVLKQSDNIF